MNTGHPYDKNIFETIPVIGVDPAAGAPYIEDVPLACRSQLVTACFTFTTAAAVADRYVYIAWRVAALEFIRFTARLAQPASQAWRYDCFISGGITEPLAALVARPQIALGIDVIMENMSDLIITADNIQGADAFTNVSLHYRTWLPGTVPR
jgi:hypothetical protein